VLIEQKIIIRWQDFQIKFTIPTDQLVKLTISRTAEGIELKSGMYVSMNVFNMCCYCLCHLKIQNGHHLEEVVSADRTKNNNKMARLSN
jgi:hypothetical protein